MRRVLFLSAVLALTPVLAGCASLTADCSFQQAYGGQRGACNKTDSFAYGVQGSPPESKTFQWENTHDQAEVLWGAQGSGSVTVAVEDADGTEVYRNTFSSGGQAGQRDTTDGGRAGLWTIRISFDGFQGQMGVALQGR